MAEGMKISDKVAGLGGRSRKDGNTLYSCGKMIKNEPCFIHVTVYVK